ncbi:uncharacterized protein LOC134765983 [Penaeus indicus]|uniref:uncharacterized protein LOC134765983 n=1 Tax=Penaeus indicus TaxID=29960 RepID=UPI00300C3C49
MALQTQSSFWLNFDTLRRSRRRNTIWASFLSPYDLPLTSEGGLLQSTLSRDARTSRSLPPRSPRAKRRGAASPAPLGPSWSLRERHHAAATVLPRADGEAGVRGGDGRCTSCTAEKKKKKKMSKKKKPSKSAEIPEGSSACRCAPGFWEQQRLLSRISRSSDELSRVKRSYLEELDLCRVGLYASRSDESLNSFGLEGPGGADVWPEAAEREGRALAHLHGSLTTGRRRSEQRRRDALGEQESEFGERRGERTRRSGQQQRLSRRSTRAAARVPAGDDHPAVTVRPGYRLPRSRSCGARACQRVASPPREGSGSPRWRSSACLGPERRGVSRALSAEPEDSEALGLVGDIPPISQLRFNKYNFRRRRPDRLELPTDPVAPQGAGRHLLPDSWNLGSFDARPRGSGPGRCECGCARAAAPQQERAAAPKASRSLLLKTFSFRSKSVDRAKASIPSPAPRECRASDAGRCPLCGPRGAAVLGEEADGRSRGLIFDGASSARTGSFPNSLVARHDAHASRDRRSQSSGAHSWSSPEVPNLGTLEVYARVLWHTGSVYIRRECFLHVQLVYSRGNRQTAVTPLLDLCWNSLDLKDTQELNEKHRQFPSLFSCFRASPSRRERRGAAAFLRGYALGERPPDPASNNTALSPALGRALPPASENAPRKAVSQAVNKDMLKCRDESERPLRRDTLAELLTLRPSLLPS